MNIYKVYNIDRWMKTPRKKITREEQIYRKKERKQMYTERQKTNRDIAGLVEREFINNGRDYYHLHKNLKNAGYCKKIKIGNEHIDVHKAIKLYHVYISTPKKLEEDWNRHLRRECQCIAINCDWLKWDLKCFMWRFDRRWSKLISEYELAETRKATARPILESRVFNNCTNVILSYL